MDLTVDLTLQEKILRCVAAGLEEEETCRALQLDLVDLRFHRDQLSITDTKELLDGAEERMAIRTVLHAEEAQQYVRRVMQASPHGDPVGLVAAKDILDRNPRTSKMDRHAVKSEVTHKLGDEDLEAIRDVAQQLSRGLNPLRPEAAEPAE